MDATNMGGTEENSASQQFLSLPAVNPFIHCTRICATPGCTRYDKHDGICSHLSNLSGPRVHQETDFFDPSLVYQKPARVPKCSICKKAGHNKLSCPERPVSYTANDPVGKKSENKRSIQDVDDDDRTIVGGDSDEDEGSPIPPASSTAGAWPAPLRMVLPLEDNGGVSLQKNSTKLLQGCGCWT